MHEGKRLYFKRGTKLRKVKRYYAALLTEQDLCSPHRYETEEFHVSEGDVVVDAGAAEGNFALSVVEKVGKLYLFETDEAWVEALQATFAAWKDKVVIVNKYVADTDSGTCISLDTFFENQRVDFIKADIEGAERQLLAGAKNILQRQASTKVVLCTYHLHDDADVLYKMLNDNGFHTEFSNGYMIFTIDKKLKAPYLRRGLIRGIKHKA
jgi:predicted RNA methylase